MTAPGPTHAFEIGQVVVRRRLASDRLVVRRAKDVRVCEDCRLLIHRGELHGSRPYTHVCLRCVHAEGQS